MITYASTIISFIALIYYSALLVFILRQKIRDRVRLYFSLYLFSMIIWSFSAFMIFADLGLLDTLFWNRFLVVGSMAMPIAFFGFVQAFLVQERRFWLRFGLLAYLAIEVVNLSGGVIVEAHTENGYLYNQYAPLGMALTGAFWAFFHLFSAYELVRAYRRSRDAAYRNRLKYLFLVVMAIFGGTLTNLTELRHFPGDVTANILSAMFITVAILRHQLLDISFVVRKGLFYSLPTLVIAASYYLVVVAAQAIFHTVQGFQLLLVLLIVALLTAVVMVPLRDRTQEWVDRLFFREKYNTSLMLQRLSQRAAYELDLKRLSEMILKEVTSTLHIERMGFFIRVEESRLFTLQAFIGEEVNPEITLDSNHPIVRVLARLDRCLTKYDLSVMPQFRAIWTEERKQLEEIGGELIIPLKVKEKLVGFFSVGAKLSGDTYTDDDQLTLMTLANQIAIAIERARLYTAEQSRREELDALYRLTRQLIALDDVDSVLQNTVQHMVHSAHVTFARLLVLEGEAVFRCRAAFSVRDSVRDLGLNEVEPSEAVLYYLRALRKADLTLLSRSDPFMSNEARAALRLDRVTSLCLSPIHLNGEPYGLFVLGEERKEAREPFDKDKLRLISAITDQAASALQRASMHEQVENTFFETILALANAMDARDTYTNNHSLRLAYLAEAVCRELHCPEEVIQAVHWAAMLHDIGKIGVPDEILRKPGPLTEEEWSIMRQHPEIGARIVAPIRKLANVAPLIRSHHENFDGSGYPNGLKGEQIPFGARLLAIVDAYGAMTDVRVYRTNRKPAEAIEELRKCSGTQFDPLLVEVFIRILEKDATRPLDPSVLGRFG